MLYPSIGQLIDGKGKCRYSLVTAVAKKTRAIAKQAEERDETLEEKPSTLAIQSFADGSSDYHEVVSPDDDQKNW